MTDRNIKPGAPITAQDSPIMYCIERAVRGQDAANSRVTELLQGMNDGDRTAKNTIRWQGSGIVQGDTKAEYYGYVHQELQKEYAAFLRSEHGTPAKAPARGYAMRALDRCRCILNDKLRYRPEVCSTNMYANAIAVDEWDAIKEVRDAVEALITVITKAGQEATDASTN